MDFCLWEKGRKDAKEKLKKGKQQKKKKKKKLLTTHNKKKKSFLGKKTKRIA